MFFYGLIQLILTATIGFAALAGNNMPDFLHPPYGTTTIQPRTLNRWLDVNSQNGPLGRNRGYISLPLNSINQIVGPQYNSISITNNRGDFTTFNLYNTSSVLLASQDCDPGDTVIFSGYNGASFIQDAGEPGFFNLPYTGWAGSVAIDDSAVWTYITAKPLSDKFLQFNYFSSRKFSVRNDDNLKAFVDTYEGKAIICITYIDRHVPYNNVIRYALTSFNQEHINAIPYSGQKIKGYFQIEFWSRMDYSLILEPTSIPVIINTSILGNQDYRYGVDFSISDSVIVTDFQNTNSNTLNIYSLPLIFHDNNISGFN